jgi:tRNA(Arg) A34 adenosine deaminase TadA
MPGTSSPPTDPNDPLAIYWNRPVSELTTVQNSAISAGDSERHTVFSLLVMALVADAWNGNKKGQWGIYPWRIDQCIQTGLYAGDRYLGHNIACIAVDARGTIIDFDFNHNDILSSSAEHAEARLVRRIFNLNLSYDGWQTINPGDIPEIPYSTVLSGVTLYTSLESCAQCSGIMTLGNVKNVVFLQSDPGQYRIGNILYNLSNPWSISHPRSASTLIAPPKMVQKYGAPEPVSADLFGFPFKAALDRGFSEFVAEVSANTANKYFWKSPNGATVDAFPSITSYLCTDDAKDVYDQAASNLAGFNLKLPTYVPLYNGVGAALSNSEILSEATRFRVFVAKNGHRGTPHR